MTETVPHPEHAHPERIRLAALVEIQLKRCDRAEAKLHCARQEIHDAQHASASARQELAAWDAMHPPAQAEMFPCQA